MKILLMVAGAVQLMIACANLFAPRMLHYRENLQRVDPIVRQIFHVHAVYVVGTVLFCAGLCLVLPGQLLTGTVLARLLLFGLAAFWGIRFGIQLFFYDPTIRKERPVMDRLFLLAFLGLTTIFAAAWWQGGGT